MITVISGTNRKDSECLQFSRHYVDMLQRVTDEEVRLLALEDIPHDWFHPEMYHSAGQSTSLVEVQDAYILPAGKMVFILPEYNGSFPGALKLFIDACSVRSYAENFKGKKVAMVGIASGRAGNLRGMEHLTGIMHYLGAIVMPDKLPISRIEEVTDREGQITDEATRITLERHAAEFAAF